MRTSRLVLQLTLAVMLLGALAPAVSRALAAARGGIAPVVDICSTQIPQRVAPVLAGSHEPPSVQTLDACPFCLLVAERLGPPPAASMHFFQADCGSAPPQEQVLSFGTEFTSAALARGPPPRG